jgi:hypothetical protein
MQIFVCFAQKDYKVAREFIEALNTYPGVQVICTSPDEGSISWQADIMMSQVFLLVISSQTEHAPVCSPQWRYALPAAQKGMMRLAYLLAGEATLPPEFADAECVSLDTLPQFIEGVRQR